MQDPYCYPGTHILKNHFGIMNSNQLFKEERRVAKTRSVELGKSDIHGNFDFIRLRIIHRYLFQDVYPWAGEVRTVDIAKGNLFCRVGLIENEANRIFGELEAEKYLKGLEEERLAERLAYYMCEINTLHPFREGNGRTQREFIRELARKNGYFLSYRDISQEEMIAASKAGFSCKYGEMEKLIRERLKKCKLGVGGG